MLAFRGNWLPYLPQYLTKAILEGLRQVIFPSVFLNGLDIYHDTSNQKQDDIKSPDCPQTFENIPIQTIHFF
jgi:hypothetical protein